MSLALGIGIGAPFGREPFNPASLFAASEPGFWADVRPAVLWQDTGRTTPVTAAGQPVASWQLNTSGAAIYATQSTAGNRPVYQVDASGRGYLEFDGATSSRGLQTPAINFTATDKVTVVAGVRKQVDVATGVIVELAIAQATAAFLLYGKANGYDWFSRGSGSAGAQVGAGYAAPVTNVLTGRGDIAADQCVLRINGVQAASSVVDQGTGTYRNDVIYIGRRGSATLPFDGRIYGLIVRGASSSNQQIAAAENWMNARTGAY